MKKIITLCLITVLIINTALAACAEEKSANPLNDVIESLVNGWDEMIGDDGGQAERERAAREADEEDKQDDRLVPIAGDDGGQAERERAAREADEQEEQERHRQEEEMRRQEEQERHRQEEEMRRQQEEQLRQGEESSEGQQGNGLFEHHIGDVIFYTLHNLWKYVVPNETNPEHMWLDLEAMLRDIWGIDEGLSATENGYVYTDSSGFVRSVSYENIGDNADDDCFVISYTGERQYSSAVISWNTPRPEGGYWIVKGDRRGYGLAPEMAALFLYVLEQTEIDPRSNIAGELGLPSNYECGAEIADDAEERSESERQAKDEAMRLEKTQEYGQDEFGRYRYKVGDAEFFTEHNLWDYVSYDQVFQDRRILDIEAMLYDIWGTDSGLYQASNGYALSDGSSFNMAASYFDVDENTANKRIVVSSTGGEEQYRSVITSWGTAEPDEGCLIVKDDSRKYGLTPELAALLLYLLEQTESSPRRNIGSELGLPPNYECWA